MITAIGGDEVLDLKGTATEVVSLGGAALLPGFVDAHVHAVLGGLMRLQCDLSEVHSLDDYRRLISEFAASNDALWVEGSGWYGDLFPAGFPTKDILDELIPDRPAVFLSHDAHSLWVNSRALEVAGIDRDTADPDGGRISRDANGNPSGQLMEHAIDLLGHVRPLKDQEMTRRALLQAQTYLHSVGVTSWQDALLGDMFGLPDQYDTYFGVAREGKLLSRVTGALLWSQGLGPDDLKKYVDRRNESAGRFRPTAVKIMLDGNCENLTAAVHEAYVDHVHEHGILQFSDDELGSAARLLSAAGFDLHIHAVGDRAVTCAVDAIASVPDLTARRHQIAHIDLIAENDIQRMRELGIIANVSPLWARLDPVLVETKLPLMTPSQQERHFLYGSLHRSGVKVAFGSDWPVSTPDPLAGIHTAVNRTAAPGDPHANDERSLREPLLPNERLTLEAALAAGTRNAAYASNLDDVVGTIAVGMEADLVVLERNPYDVPSDEIGMIRVTRTFVRGQTVHEAP
ncbi:amidohydrolase [Rhodococcus sp. (in: high G+C Gram-positive bacteria)]|uniref:amidohydrolase n=1 Tax=Rhodococcus sp. TaxID=1831 RepID=UPI00257CF893|nr:amidohydrolase [Rhodococcus sp. (in: high G+C Gram-positive bacteria)]MBQ7803126.1 amidohydrolase [Rhodococcus sp. (in: high G+C Gram-positive bacteria)]